MNSRDKVHNARDPYFDCDKGNDSRVTGCSFLKMLRFAVLSVFS